MVGLIFLIALIALLLLNVFRLIGYLLRAISRQVCRLYGVYEKFLVVYLVMMLALKCMEKGMDSGTVSGILFVGFALICTVFLFAYALLKLFRGMLYNLCSFAGDMIDWLADLFFYISGYFGNLYASLYEDMLKHMLGENNEL